MKREMRVTLLAVLLAVASSSSEFSWSLMLPPLAQCYPCATPQYGLGPPYRGTRWIASICAQNISVPRLTYADFILTFDTVDGTMVSNASVPELYTVTLGCGNIFYSDSVINSETFVGDNSTARPLMLIGSQDHVLSFDVFTGDFLGAQRGLLRPAGGPGSSSLFVLRVDDDNAPPSTFALLQVFNYNVQSYPVTINPDTYNSVARFGLLQTSGATGNLSTAWRLPYSNLLTMRPIFLCARSSSTTGCRELRDWSVMYINSTALPYLNNAYLVSLGTGELQWSAEIDNSTAVLWSMQSVALVVEEANMVLFVMTSGRATCLAAYRVDTGALLWRNTNFLYSQHTFHHFSLPPGNPVCAGEGKVPHCFMTHNSYNDSVCIRDIQTAASIVCFDVSMAEDDRPMYNTLSLLLSFDKTFMLVYGQSSVYVYRTTPILASDGSTYFRWNPKPLWTFNTTKYILSHYKPSPYPNQIETSPSFRTPFFPPPPPCGHSSQNTTWNATGFDDSIVIVMNAYDVIWGNQTSYVSIFDRETGALLTTTLTTTVPVIPLGVSWIGELLLEYYNCSLTQWSNCVELNITVASLQR